MDESTEKVLVSKLPKPEPGLAANSTLWSFVDARVNDVISRFGDRVLMVDGSSGATYTYSEFRSLVKRLASVLRGRYGVGEGSVVILCSKNSIYLPVCLYASFALEAVTFSVPSYSHDNIPTYLRLEESVPVVFCDKEILNDVKGYVSEVKREKSEQAGWQAPEVVLVDGDDAECQNTKALLTSDDADENIEFPETDPAEECMVFFSSGSTGPPKPISHSHRNLLSCTYNTWRYFTEYEKDDVKLFNVNHAHIGGFLFFLGNIASGSTCVTFSRNEPGRLLETIDRHRVTSLCLYPKDAIFLSKVKDWSGYDLTRVKHIAAGSAMFPPSIIEPLKKMFTGLTSPIAQIYGSTEILLIASSAATEAGEVESGLGYIMPFVKCKVIDLETQQTLGPRQPGEFWLWSPFRMLGYRKRPDLTKEALTPDGWYKTGDYGYYDEDERLHIMERVKDLIRLETEELVPPSVIEDIILRHDGVLQVGVAGIPSPDDLKGAQRPRAFVIKRSEATITPEDIVNFVKGETSEKRFQLTGGAEFIDSMVMSPGGKVYRMKLRDDHLKRSQKQNGT